MGGASSSLPAAMATAQECIDAAYGILRRRADAAPNARRWKLKGNHDWRIESELLMRAERLYGLHPEDLGAPMEQNMDHVHPDDRARVREALAESLRTGQMFVCDHRAVLPDGTVRIMHGLANVIRDDQGRAVKMIGTTQDVTET